MANTKINHNSVKFNQMSKNQMYINARQAEVLRSKINSNYISITNAWKEIEKSFKKLEAQSSGTVKEMFTQAVAAAKTKGDSAEKRNAELDSGLKKDTQTYAKALLETATIAALIGNFASAGEDTEVVMSNTLANGTSKSYSESLGTIDNIGNDNRYQGSDIFYDKDGNEYIATVQCDTNDGKQEGDTKDYSIVIFKKDESGNYQQMTSKKISLQHGNSVTTKYNPETNKVEIYTTKKYTQNDEIVGGSKKEVSDQNKICKYEYDINDNKLGKEKIIELDESRASGGSVSIDADNDLYATSSGFKLSVSQGDFTNDAEYYKLESTQMKENGLRHQSGCIHGDTFYKLVYDGGSGSNYVLTYDLTQKQENGVVPIKSIQLIEKNSSREIEDISWNSDMGGLVASINNKKTNGKRSTEIIKL